MIHKGRFVSKVDTGRIRITSDDNALATINSNGDILLCVCDGMGGYKSGDFASKIVIDELRAYYKEYSTTPDMRVLITTLKKKGHTDLASSVTLARLFPDGAAKTAAKLAGLPKPVKCI